MRLLGIELSPVSHTERIVSAAGGFLGIYGIVQVSSAYVGPFAAALIVASMGASAVWLYAVPRGPMSQPWSVIGGHLSNGRYGSEWLVRQIVDQSRADDAASDMLIYKVLAGDGRRSSGVATREEFSRWAKHEVYRDDENWRRVSPDTD